MRGFLGTPSFCSTRHKAHSDFAKVEYQRGTGTKPRARRSPSSERLVRRFTRTALANSTKAAAPGSLWLLAQPLRYAR